MTETSRQPASPAPSPLAMRDDLAGLRGLTRPYDPSRPVLVAVDLQRAFVDPASPLYLRAWEQAAGPAGVLMEAFARAGRPIVLTRHAHGVNDSPNLLGHFFDRLLMDGDPLAEFGDCVGPYLESATLHTKSCHAAFACGLPDCLTDASVIVLIGVQTPLCVTATALDLARYGRVPLVVADACAATDEAGHRAALRVLACGHAHIRSAATLLSELGFAQKAEVGA